MDDRIRGVLLAVLLAIPGSLQTAAHADDDIPAFCRTGEGHPVFGPRWCIEKGYGLGGDPEFFPFPGAYRDNQWRRDRHEAWKKAAEREHEARKKATERQREYWKKVRETQREELKDQQELDREWRKRLDEVARERPSRRHVDHETRHAAAELERERRIIEEELARDDEEYQRY